MKTGTKTAAIAILMCSFAFSFAEAQNRFNNDDSEGLQKQTALVKSDKFTKMKLPSITALKSMTDNDIKDWVQQNNEGGEWLDEERAIYEYSTDRNTITIHFEYNSGGTWIEMGSQTYEMSSNGYPLRINLNYSEAEISQTFHYADVESGRLDSVLFYENSSGEELTSRTDFNYVSNDSVRMTEYITSANSETEYATGYLANRGDDFVEYYDSEEDGYIDRYVYSDTNIEDYFKNLMNEFHFVEVYNDEYWYDEEEWTPYSRTTVTLEEGVVTEEFVEVYDDGWFGEENRLINYSDGKITQIVDERNMGLDWEAVYRTNYTYGAVVSNETQNEQVQGFKLSQNYPNPFNPITQINYNIPNAGEVSLDVFNVLGNKVATLAQGRKAAGEYTATFDASNFPSGMYYYKLQYAGAVEVRAMTLIK